MSRHTEQTPEIKRTTQENFIYHVAWMVGALALLTVGVDSAHDILTHKG
jgi:hypothetical protein